MNDWNDPAAADAIARLAAQALLYRSILDALPMGVTVYEIVPGPRYRMSFINAKGRGAESLEKFVGTFMEEVLPPDVVRQISQRHQECIETGSPVAIEDSYQLPEMLMWTRSVFAPIRDESGQITHIMSVWEDITAQKIKEQEELARREEIISHQAATLAELSTPILSISETAVVMPLVGAVDSRRVQQMMDIVLTGVAERHATTVILDITGVPVVDTQVADAFFRISQAVRLLGAQVVLTGIRPEVAQTIVGLGVDMHTIITRNSLRDGIAYALRQ